MYVHDTSCSPSELGKRWDDQFSSKSTILSLPVSTESIYGLLSYFELRLRHAVVIQLEPAEGIRIAEINKIIIYSDSIWIWNGVLSDTFSVFLAMPTTLTHFDNAG